MTREEPGRLALDERCSRSVLPDGLKVISERMDHVRSISLGVWIRAGSREEEEAESGISHMIEHMLFKGTPTRDARQIALALESLGGYLSAFTSEELTCFYARFLDEHLPVAVDVLSDILANSTIDEEELGREKRVIGEEIKRFEDSPDKYAHFLLSMALFDGHPLATPIMGTMESVAAFTRAGVLRSWRSRYTHENVVIASSGNIDHDRLVDRISRSFRFFPSTPRSDLSPPADRAPCLEGASRDISQVHLCLGTRTKGYPDPDRYPLMILNSIVGEGMSSRLFQRVREQMGLVYTIYSFFHLYRDTGQFGIYLATDPTQAKQAMQVVGAECRRLLEEGLDERELEDAKSQLKGGLVLTLESTSARMMRLAEMELFLETYVSLDETIAAIDAVTEEDVMRVAQQVLDTRNLSVGAVGPLDTVELTLEEVQG
jgi:predicted Zn-dependent peptidase